MSKRHAERSVPSPGPTASGQKLHQRLRCNALLFLLAGVGWFTGCNHPHHEEAHAVRRDHLHGTFDLIETSALDRRDHWRSGATQRRWRSLFFGGHPERIDDTYSKMFH